MAAYQIFLLILFLSCVYCANVKFPPKRLPLQGNHTLARESSNLTKSPSQQSQLLETSTRKFLRMPPVKTSTRYPDAAYPESVVRVREQLPSRRRMPSMASLRKNSNSTRRNPSIMQRRHMTVEAEPGIENLELENERPKENRTIPYRQTQRRNQVRGNTSTRRNPPENLETAAGFDPMEKSIPQAKLANTNIPIQVVNPDSHPQLFKAISKPSNSEIDSAASDFIEIVYPTPSTPTTDASKPEKIDHKFTNMEFTESSTSKPEKIGPIFHSTNPATAKLQDSPKNTSAFDVSQMTFLDSAQITDLPSEVINTIAEAQPIQPSTTTALPEISSRKDKVFVVYAQGIQEYLKEIGHERNLDSLDSSKVYPAPSHSFDSTSRKTNEEETPKNESEGGNEKTNSEDHYEESSPNTAELIKEDPPPSHSTDTVSPRTHEAPMNEPEGEKEVKNPEGHDEESSPKKAEMSKGDSALSHSFASPRTHEEKASQNQPEGEKKKTTPGGQDEESSPEEAESMTKEEAEEVKVVTLQRKKYSYKKKGAEVKVAEIPKLSGTEKKFEVFPEKNSWLLEPAFLKEPVVVITPKYSNTKDENTSDKELKGIILSAEGRAKGKLSTELIHEKKIVVTPEGSSEEKKIKIVPVGSSKEQVHEVSLSEPEGFLNEKKNKIVPVGKPTEQEQVPKERQSKPAEYLNKPEQENDSPDDLDTGESDPEPSFYITRPEERTWQEPFPRTQTEVRHQTSTVRRVQNAPKHQEPQITQEEPSFDDPSLNSRRQPFFIYVPPIETTTSAQTSPLEPQNPAPTSENAGNDNSYVYLLTKKDPEPISPEYVYLLTEKEQPQKTSEDTEISGAGYKTQHPQEISPDLQDQNIGYHYFKNTRPEAPEVSSDFPQGLTQKHPSQFAQKPAQPPRTPPQNDLHASYSTPVQNSHYVPDSLQPSLSHHPLENKNSELDSPHPEDQKYIPPSILPQGHYSSNNFPYPRHEIKAYQPLPHLTLPKAETNSQFSQNVRSEQNSIFRNKPFFSPSWQPSRDTPQQTPIHYLPPIRNIPFESNQLGQKAVPQTISIRNDVTQTYNGQVLKSEGEKSASLFGGFFSFLG